MDAFMAPYAELLQISAGIAPEAPSSPIAEEIARTKSFLEVLRQMEAATSGQAERKQLKTEEDKAILEKNGRIRDINELRGLVARLRQKYINSNYDRRIAAELSLAQSQLFWLMFAL